MPATTAASSPLSGRDIPAQQFLYAGKLHRKKLVVLSAIGTALVVAAVAVLCVEQTAPTSLVAGWLRNTSCSKAPLRVLNANSSRNITLQSKRRRRRLEDGRQRNEGGNGNNAHQQAQWQDDDFAWEDDYDYVDDAMDGGQYGQFYFYDDDFYAMPRDPGPRRLFPLTSRDVAAYVLAAMGLTLGSSGGIGGGGIVVPVYILVAGLTPKMAIPLGAVTVLGGAVASTMINWKRRHPLADRPIIDWDLVLVTEPLTLVGALTGTLLHRMLSEKFLIVLLVLLLSVSAHSTLAKAKRMYDAESRYIKKLKELHLSEELNHNVVPTSAPATRLVPPSTVVKPRRHQTGPVEVFFAPRSPSLSPTEAVGAPLIQGIRSEDDCLSIVTCEHHANDNTTIDNDTSFDDCDSSSILKSPSEVSTARQLGVEERQQILILNPDFITLRSGLMEEEKFTPRSKIIALCLMFSILMFLNIMIGGGAFPSPWGIRCGSVAFWVVQVIMVAFLISSAWAAQTYLVNRHYMKEIVCFDYVHGDIKWDARSAIIYPALFICAGTFAGMFGIGGGMIAVPLMLAMGVHPAVVSATSSAMILFTSFASASSYLVFGLILYDYAIVCFVVGFFASMFGNTAMRQARQAKSPNGRNFERNSYTAFCIGGVILVSALLMTIDYIFRVYALENMDYSEGLCEGYRI